MNESKEVEMAYNGFNDPKDGRTPIEYMEDTFDYLWNEHGLIRYRMDKETGMQYRIFSTDSDSVPHRSQHMMSFKWDNNFQENDELPDHTNDWVYDGDALPTGLGEMTSESPGWIPQRAEAQRVRRELH